MADPHTPTGNVSVDLPLRPEVAVRELDDGIVSALAPGDVGAPYDTKAWVYDTVVGHPIYVRLAWGAHPRDFTRFAAEAVASGDGPLLDVGCGSLAFTAPVYARSRRPLVLSDRSVGMLRIGARRLAAERGPGTPALLQADLFDLPFRARSFETVACHGVLHLFDEREAVLASLWSQVAPGGSLWFTSLVTRERHPFSNAFLGMLHRSGEVGPPVDSARVHAWAQAATGLEPALRQAGAMACLVVRRPA